MRIGDRLQWIMTVLLGGGEDCCEKMSEKLVRVGVGEAWMSGGVRVEKKKRDRDREMEEDKGVDGGIREEKR